MSSCYSRVPSATFRLNEDPQKVVDFFVYGKDPNPPNWMNRFIRWVQTNDTPLIHKTAAAVLIIFTVCALGMIAESAAVSLAIGAILIVGGGIEILKIREASAAAIRNPQEMRASREMVKKIFGSNREFDDLPDVGYFPKVAGPNGKIDYFEAAALKFPIAQGEDRYGRLCIPIVVKDISNPNSQPTVLTIFERFPGQGKWSCCFEHGFKKEFLSSIDWLEIGQIVRGEHHQFRVVDR